MAQLSWQRPRGFTRTELVVVIVVILVLLSMLLPAIGKHKVKAERIWCMNNLKEIGVAERLFSGTSQSNAPLASLGAKTNAGPYCWTYFAIEAEDSKQSPGIFVCPADERNSVAYFAKGGGTNANGKGMFKDNTTVSYFVNIDASDGYPQSIAFGDRNIGPGIIPHNDYGFSPTNGQGNDVVINGPVCWSLKMHSASNTAGAGNILLGDGSVQQVSSANLNKNWVTNAMATSTNYSGLRLVFP